MNIVAVFNGLDLLGLALALALLAFAVYAARRHRREGIDYWAEIWKDDPAHWPLAEDLDIARVVRKSYDGLPYRRSWGRAEP